MREMSETKDFVPMTPQLGIAGSSYQLQLGRVSEYWAIRLVKGRDVLDSKVFKDEDNDDIPNANHLTGWVLSVLVLPNVNTYQIQKTIGFIRQKAIANFEEQKLKKKSAGKSESRDVVLEKTPEAAIKRPQSTGWVKEGSSGVADDSGYVSPSLAASNRVATGKTGTTAGGMLKNRKLTPIPFGEGYEPNTQSISNGVSKAKTKIQINATPSLFQSNEFFDVLKRLDTLEQQVQKLMADNAALRKQLALR
jgi:hypothetical protein